MVVFQACNEFFHNRCSGSPVSKEVFNHIVNTPDWVKVFCPKCLVTTNKSVECIEEIKQIIVDKLEENNKQKENTSFSAVVSRKLESEVKQTNKLVGDLFKRQTGPTAKEENRERNERTCIVRKPLDSNIKNSRDIRKAVNQKYPGTVMRNVRYTAAGSILLEFDEKNETNVVVENWDNTMFGGNSGILRCDQNKPAGIIKHVYEDEKSVQQITQEIEEKYPNTESELFMKDEKFIGTIKITFKDQAALDDAKINKMKLFHQNYIVEDYQSKPRVIICRRCTKFGHVNRLCTGNIKCWKCSSNEHEGKDCVVTAEHYKCAHCNGKHTTGSRNCQVFKDKEEELINRSRNV